MLATERHRKQRKATEGFGNKELSYFLLPSVAFLCVPLLSMNIWLSVVIAQIRSISIFVYAASDFNCPDFIQAPFTRKLSRIFMVIFRNSVSCAPRADVG